MKAQIKSTKIGKFIAKHWIIMWIVVASVLLITLLSVWGAYTNTDQRMKRVVAPYSTTNSLFTSNYLKLGTSTIESAFFDQLPHTYSVIIRNHDPSDPETMFNGSIPYTLYAYLAHKDGTLYNSSNDSAALTALGNMEITINCGTDTITLNRTTLEGSNSSHTLSKTTGNHENTWTVSYDDDIPLGSDYCVKLIAEPDASTNLASLSATIIVDSYPIPNPSGWSCELAESGEEDIDDFDAFNYTISGTGKRTLTFSYDATKLIVNPACYQFFSDVAAPEDVLDSSNQPTGWKTIVINADPDTTLINRYDFQVYKIEQPSSFNDVTPNGANSWVTFNQATVSSS